MQNVDKSKPFSSHVTNVFGDKDVLYNKFKRSSDLNISMNAVAKNSIKLKDTLKTQEERAQFQILFKKFYSLYKDMLNFTMVDDL